jgi:hypothetical protein
MIVDMKNGQDVSGVIGCISWKRLIEVLRAAGEIKQDETITHLSLGEKVMTYRVEKLPI